MKYGLDDTHESELRHRAFERSPRSSVAVPGKRTLTSGLPGNGTKWEAEAKRKGKEKAEKGTRGSVEGAPSLSWMSLFGVDLDHEPKQSAEISEPDVDESPEEDGTAAVQLIEGRPAGAKGEHGASGGAPRAKASRKRRKAKKLTIQQAVRKYAPLVFLAPGEAGPAWISPRGWRERRAGERPGKLRERSPSRLRSYGSRACPEGPGAEARARGRWRLTLGRS